MQIGILGFQEDDAFTIIDGKKFANVLMGFE